MAQFNQTDKITLIGRSGCGKSHLGKMIQPIFPRLFIFDSVDEYDHTENDIYSYDQLASFIKNQAPELDKFVRIIRIDNGDDHDLLIFDEMIKLLYHFGNVFIVVEEIQDFATPYKITKGFKKALTSGRHKNIGFIFTTQRPALTSKTVLSQSTHIFVGNLIDENDTSTMARMMRQKPDRFVFLKDREFLWFCPQRGGDKHTIEINTNKYSIDKKTK